MKRFIMLSVMVLSLGMVGIVNGGTLYVSLNDAMWAVGWYDLDGNYVNMRLFPEFVQDIEFDKTTGDLFALTDTGIFRMNQGLALTQITGAAYPDAGGDIAISSNGYVAASLTDAMPSVGIYDLDGNYVGMVTFPSAVADIEYDQATGDLIAYTATGVFKMTDLGPPAVVTQIPGIAGAAQGQGGDIAISSNGLIAVSMNDSMNSVGIYYLTGGTGPGTYYDMANFNSPVADIDYDMNTGDLYALTAVGIKKGVDNGPYNGTPVTPIPGTAGAELNGGGDLAWAPDWECADEADCYDDDACTVDDCECSVDNLCTCGESTPLVCPSDDNDCTDDIPCDPVDGCVYTCNATGYLDACCLDDACSEEPVCEHPSCFGSTALGE